MLPSRLHLKEFVHTLGRERKALRSIGNGACVEIAPASGTIAVRDSKDPAGPVLRYSADAWKAFLSEAGRGDFDRVH